MERNDGFEDLDARLADLGARTPAPAGSILPAFQEIRADLIDATRGPRATARTRPRHARRWTAAAVAAVALATGGGVAAARWTSSHTQTFGDAGMTENDTSEWLDASGDDFNKVALELARGVPFPARDAARNYVDVVFPRDGLIQVSGVTKTFILGAVCAWSGTWLTASNVGDATTATGAATALSDGSRWPSVDRTTPTELGRRASEGDRGGVQAFWDANCSTLPSAWARP